jgi:hypothetical protein
VPEFTPVFDKLPVEPDFSTESLQPVLILEHGLVKKGNATITQVRIKWVGLPDTAATWEDWHVLLAQFPAIASWGQAGSSAAGVTPVASG